MLSRIPSGYLIGRALQREGPGPWWEYIAIVVDRETALARISEIARDAGVAAWLTATRQFEPIVTRSTPG